MLNYIAKLDIEIENEELEYKLINVPILIKKDEISIKTIGIQSARAYLDAFRSILNFINFDNLKDNPTHIDLVKCLYMPPYKLIINQNNCDQSEGTIYFYRYEKVKINKNVDERINEITEIANQFDENCQRHSNFPQFRHMKIPHLYLYLTLRNLLRFRE